MTWLPFRAFVLVLRLHAADSTLPARAVLGNVTHALAVETRDLPAELLLAIAYVESRLEPDAVSDPHRGWPKFCGVLQTVATTARECVAQRDLDVAYPLGVAELAAWLRYCRGNRHCALLGYGCGIAGVTSGRCNRYPERVTAAEAGLR